MKQARTPRTISMNCSYPRLTHPSLSWSARLKAVAKVSRRNLKSAEKLTLGELANGDAAAYLLGGG